MSVSCGMAYFAEDSSRAHLSLTEEVNLIHTHTHTHINIYILGKKYSIYLKLLNWLKDFGYICWGVVGFPESSVGKESACSAGDPQFDSWIRKIHWGRDRLPTPVFLGFSCGSAGKESACSVGRPGFDPWAGKIPWRSWAIPNSSILAWRIPWTV